LASLTGIVATTETEAFNEMLAAIGQSPVADIDAAVGVDAVIAKNLLRTAIREILSEGWRFNQEFGYELPRTTTQAWTGSDGSTATLGVFEVPAALLRFEMTRNSGQAGSAFVDAVARKGRAYDATKTIFYDRAKNRDGWDITERTFLYIDPVWYMDFSFIPQTIRNLITVTASRRLAAKVVASDTLVGFTAADEAQARRLAKRDQGEEDTYNMLDNAGVYGALGRNRTFSNQGRGDTRNSPGKV
jgi:tail tube protein